MDEPTQKSESSYSTDAERDSLFVTSFTKRTMKCYNVTGTELDLLSRQGTEAGVSLILASGALGYAADWFLESKASGLDEAPTVIVVLMIGFVIFTVFGIWKVMERRTLAGLIKDQSEDVTGASGS